MRKPFMAGNWKLHKTIPEAVQLVEALKDGVSDIDTVTIGVCPPFVAIPAVHDVLEGTNIKVGAQNMYWEESGAYTGEVSPTMLQGIADMVIIGHSERRQYFGETDETVNKKLKAALAHDLLPIVAVGESLEQNEAGETKSWVSGQVRGAFDGITAEQARGVVVAYEPIWAIGTGLAATPEQANSIIGEVVRGTLADLYGKDVAEDIIIQYGGSIKPANVRELMEQPDIDGGLVGGASLKAEDFITLVKVTAEVYG